jgi:hypothetical protein
MTRLTVQFHARGQYGEFTAKSEELSEQEMADKMHAEAKPGVALRFLGSDGVVVPTGYEGDGRVYIEH